MIAHQSAGTTNSVQRPRPLARSRMPSVPTAVGSGATPNSSTVFHPRVKERAGQRLDREGEEEDPETRPAGRPFKRQPSAHGPDPEEERRFEPERGGEIDRDGIDRRVTARVKRDGDPEPASGEDRRDHAAAGRARAAQRARGSGDPGRPRRSGPARSWRCTARRAGNTSAGRRGGDRGGSRSTTPTALQLFDDGNDAAAHRLVGEPAVATRRCSRARGPPRLVAGIAQETAGCETMNFSRTCAQFAQSISAAHGGSGECSTFRIRSPRRSGRLQITATRRSRASGRSRSSTSRSRTL